MEAPSTPNPPAKLNHDHVPTRTNNVSDLSCPTTTLRSSHRATVAALKDITFGSLAGILGKTIEYPFDTVKVRLQAQHTRYAGPLDCFGQALKHDGVLGLYRGLSVPLVGAAAEMSSLFVSV